MPDSIAHLQFAAPDVKRCKDLEEQFLVTFLGALGLTVVQIDDHQAIPGSHWGDDEAGLIQQTLYVRSDTPVHSALHEACHWLLMNQERRRALHTDAGGTQTEENAVCFLQILLADYVPDMDRARMCRDMDRWGYNFRLSSAAAWFAEDAADAFAFLQARDWIAADTSYTAADIKPILKVLETIDE